LFFELIINIFIYTIFIMDSIVFEESVNSEISSSEFVDKQWLYVNDNNNGSYSSQIVLDTTPLSNSGQYINWSEAFLLMPLILQIESSVGVLNADNNFDYLGALKSGYWNMLHSLTCEFNNGNIIQQVPFLNVFCSFKNLTSWSKDDLTNWSSVTGFRPDSAMSWCYSNAVPAAAGLPVQTGGTGLANNRDAPYVSITALAVSTSTFTGTPVAGALPDPFTPAGTVATTTSVRAYNQLTQATLASNDVRAFWNEGLFERQLDLNYDPTLNSVAGSTFSSNKGVLMTPEGANTVFRSFVNKVAQSRWYNIDAIIRLKDVADFFQKCPMLKGSTMRIYINTNQVYYTLRLVGGRFAAATGSQNEYGSAYLTSAPVILGGGGTNPTIFPSVDLGQGSNLLVPLTSDAGAANTASVSVGLSIVRTQFSQLTERRGNITSCRLYAPAYTMNPIAEQRYLSLTPTKKVVYNDIFQFSFPNQSGAGSSFNILVTNGIPNIRSVLVVPLINRESNGVAPDGLAAAPYNVAGQTTSTLLSPFCSTPASPDPISIENFQIQVSGRNLFINQLQYDFETFYEQLVCSNQLNGSLTTSLASGLISKRDFQSLYRYYYGNCSRGLPSEEGVSKAIQIIGNIRSAAKVDLMVFVEFEREITIDVRTGARIA
jgi:hypothetical protein